MCYFIVLKPTHSCHQIAEMKKKKKRENAKNFKEWLKQWKHHKQPAIPNPTEADGHWQKDDNQAKFVKNTL